MDKEEAQLIIQNIDKILGKSVQKEDIQETKLDEALPVPGAMVPTLGAFLRGHRIINQYMLIVMTVFPKTTVAHKIVAAFQKPLGAFVEAMDEFYSNHKVLFGLLFGAMLAMDLFGTSAVVAKEKFLIILRKKLADKYGLEDAGSPTAPAALTGPRVIDAEFTEEPSEDDKPLREQFNRMQELAGIKKII